MIRQMRSIDEQAFPMRVLLLSCTIEYVFIGVLLAVSWHDAFKLRLI